MRTDLLGRPIAEPLKTAMYTPQHFAENRPEQLHKIIRDHPLGAIVTAGQHGFDADHIPFELDPTAGPQGRLLAHVARSNNLWNRGIDGAGVLVIFRGAESYISPNWYPSKHEAHRQVPTWNYEVVHAHGILTVHDDERFVRGLVARLTRQHEAAESVPWMMGDAPPDFIANMLQNIVGIQVAITSLVGKRKLSQNREPRDVDGAAGALNGLGKTELADSMRSAREDEQKI